MERKNAIFIILDGLGDLPVKELGGKTPLQAAKKPNLDIIAKTGACGVMDIAGGKAVESDIAHLILFGYNPVQEHPGRGPLEALGAGIDLQEGDIAFRGNLACVDTQNIIQDRRAGRDIPNAQNFVKSINGIIVEAFPEIKFHVVHSTEQRFACVVHGPGLSHAVMMPNETRSGIKASECKPLDESEAAKNTAFVVNMFVKKASEILTGHPANDARVKSGLSPVNMVLLYGPGKMINVPSIKQRYNVDVACVAGNGLIKGICKFLGMVIVPCSGATGTSQTDIYAKVRKVLEIYEKYDLTFLHVKATDTFGHDKQPVRKKEFIEKVDAAIGYLLSNIDLGKTFLFISGDHATPCSIGNHSNDPVPFVMAGPTVIRDHIASFDEKSCAGGYLLRFEGKHVFPIILNKIDKLKKFGA